MTAGELNEQVEHLDAVSLLLLLGGVAHVDDDQVAPSPKVGPREQTVRAIKLSTSFIP